MTVQVDIVGLRLGDLAPRGRFGLFAICLGAGALLAPQLVAANPAFVQLNLALARY